MSSDLDYELARLLQAQFDEDEDLDRQTVPRPRPRPSSSYADDKALRSGGDKPLSIVDERWEMIDPTPDVRAMFIEFDNQFFSGRLAGVEVKWSPRMTLCAGVCSYEGRGGLCSIRLSTPLLKLRPRKDLVETLLHEMIHAYLFVTQNNKDRDGHGPEFCKHMNSINKETGTKISIYHNFQDEVNLYRQHIWRCDGPCRTRKPFFGYVRRAMNRAPSPRDPWWSTHQQTCGGTYHKEKEPEGYGEKKGKRKREEDDTKGAKKSKGRDINSVPAFEGKGQVLNDTSSLKIHPTLEEIWSKKQPTLPNTNKSLTTSLNDGNRAVGSVSKISNGNLKPSGREHKDATKTDTSGVQSNIHGFFGKKSSPAASIGKYEANSDDESKENSLNDPKLNKSDNTNGSIDIEVRFPGRGQALGGRAKTDMDRGGAGWLSKDSQDKAPLDKVNHETNKNTKHLNMSRKIIKLMEIVGSDSDSDTDEKISKSNVMQSDKKPAAVSIYLIDSDEEGDDCNTREESQNQNNAKIQPNVGIRVDNLPKTNNRSGKAETLGSTSSSDPSARSSDENDTFSKDERKSGAPGGGTMTSIHSPNADRKMNPTFSDMHAEPACTDVAVSPTVRCPICGCSVLEPAINQHLDECLNHSFLSQ